MKASITKESIIIVAFVAILGFGSYAYAGWGMGYRHGGGHHRGGYQSEYLNQLGLSAEEISKLDQEYVAFMKKTEDTRQALNAKELEMKSEMSKEEPDKNKVFDIQKEISNLKGSLNKKTLEYELKTRKINPDNRMGYMGRNHMMEWGRGPMMGYGSRLGGYGNCW